MTMAAPANLPRGNITRKPFDILGLPDVVKVHLCMFLDTSCLMNLRLTCKPLKSMVEQAAILERLSIKISSSKQLQRVLESEVKFNNFTCSFKSLEEQTYFGEFAERFGKCMRKLRITTRGGHQKTLKLLAQCTQLKELEIQTVDPSVYDRSDYWETALKNLHGSSSLRKLTIHQLGGESRRRTGKEQICFFLKLLNICKHLTEFKIPSINEYNQKLTRRQRLRQCRGFHEQDRVLEVNNEEEEDWEQETVQDNLDPIPEWDDGNSQDILIHPILNYIKMKTNNVKLPQLKCIDVQSISLFEWSTFKDFVQVCHESGTRLSGVQAVQFGHLKNEILFFNPNYNDVVQSARLSCIHENFPLIMCSNLNDLEVYINPGKWFSGLGNDSDLTLPHLKLLRVQFFSANDFQTQLLVKKLFKEQKRPSLEKLQLQWFLQDNSPTICTMDLANNFRNIKELEISAWNTMEDSDFCTLWINLQNLEKIAIKDCKNITNRAFFGNFNVSDDRNIDRRPLNRLKKLRSLTIRDISGNVNEDAFMNSFKWIKLSYFEFESTVIPYIREQVYRSLMRAPLGKSVEYFVAPPPQLSIFDRKSLMKGFKNLKRRVSW